MIQVLKDGVFRNASGHALGLEGHTRCRIKAEPGLCCRFLQTCISKVVFQPDSGTFHAGSDALKTEKLSHIIWSFLPEGRGARDGGAGVSQTHDPVGWASKSQIEESVSLIPTARGGGGGGGGGGGHGVRRMTPLGGLQHHGMKSYLNA